MSENPNMNIESGVLDRSIESVGKKFANLNIKDSNASIDFINRMKILIFNKVDRIADMSIGEMITFIQDTYNNTEVALNPFKIVSGGMLFHSIVRLYTKVAFYSQERLLGQVHGDQMRARNIRMLMIWGALPITYALLTMATHSPLDGVQIKIGGGSSSDNQNLMALFFLTGGPMFNRNNRGI